MGNPVVQTWIQRTLWRGVGARTPPSAPEFQSPHGTAWESHQSAALRWWNHRPAVLEPLRSEELQDGDPEEKGPGV